MVDNKGEKLKRDMYCTVTGDGGNDSNAIAVPDAAVLRDDENQPFVYVASSAQPVRPAARSRSAKARTARRKF